MFRTLNLLAVPAMTLALTLVAADNSASQAFARGGSRGSHVSSHSNHSHYRNFGRYGFDRCYGSYCWQYPCYYGCAQYTIPVLAEPVVPEPVVQVPVTCPTYEPVYSCVESNPYWWGGYRSHYRHNTHSHSMSHSMHGGRR